MEAILTHETDVIARLFAPTGVLRVSINLGNSVLAELSPSTGRPIGVSVDLAFEFASRLGLPLQLVVAKSAAESVANLEENSADVGFFAIDPKRGEAISFSHPYVLIEGCYVVRDASPIVSNEQVDQPGVSIAVGKGSAYDLFLTRDIRRAGLVRFAPVGSTVQGFVDRQLEVVAGVQQQLEKDALPRGGLRMLPERFMVIRQAMGVPKARGSRAAGYLDAFARDVAASGFVARSLASHNKEGVTVAGPDD